MSSTPTMGRRTFILLAPFAVAAAAGGWLCAPYLQGEREYARVRAIAGAQPQTNVADASSEQRPAATAADEDPCMDRSFDWDALYRINADVIGWIYIPNTPIDYPIVQAPADDPERYLHTTFEGAVSYPNNQGAIYLDASNADDGLNASAPLLYGHQQLNGSMFSALSNNHIAGVLEEHDQAYVYTPSTTWHIGLFAANAVDASTETVQTSFRDASELQTMLEEKLAESEVILYDPGRIEQLWTFCTCSYGIWQNQRTLTYGYVIERRDAT